MSYKLNFVLVSFGAPISCTLCRETIDDYTKKIKSISVILFEAMAKSLDLEENCFVKNFTEERDVLHGRFILYPPCPTPDKVLGLKAHSDRSGITLLLQDPGVEGLQVLNNGKWYNVPVIRDALFVNIGDQMEVNYHDSEHLRAFCIRICGTRSQSFS